MKKITIVTYLLLLSVVTAWSQGSQIQLLERNTRRPISNATYEYGNQYGTANSVGVFAINYKKGEILKISHVEYEPQKLTDRAIILAIKAGKLLMDKKVINLYPVTVIAVQDKEKPGLIDLDYRDKMAHDAGMLFNQTPAISVIRKSGGYGFDPVLRGFKYDQLNIVYNNGQACTAACPNRMDPPISQMTPNMVDRVEVLKGPHALRYGVGLGGTVNFIPQPLNFSYDDTKVYGCASGGYEHNGQIKRSEISVGISGERLDFSLFGAWAQGDDYKDGAGKDVAATFTKGSFGAQLGWQMTDLQELRISATRNLARNVDFPALPMDLRSDDTWLFNLAHKIDFKRKYFKKVETSLYGSFVDHKMDNFKKVINLRKADAETLAETFNYGARSEAFWNFGRMSLFAGLDYKTEGADGTRTRNFLMGKMKGKSVDDNVWQDSYIRKAGAFLEYKMDAGIVQFVLSARGEYNMADANEPDPKFKQANSKTSSKDINPSVSAGIMKGFRNNSMVSVWFGRVQRSAGLSERYINYFPVGLDPYEMVGNPELKPEVNNQFDVTYEWKSHKTAVNIDLFYASLKNYISSEVDKSLVPRMPISPGVRKFANIDKARKMGFEVNWSQKLWYGLSHQFSVAYTKGDNLTADEPLPEIAPLDMRLALIGRYFDNKLHPEIAYRYVLKQDRISKAFGETETPAFMTLDAKLSYQITPWMNATVGMQNILDEEYYEHLSRSAKGTKKPIYALGRNAFVSLNLVF